MYKICMRDAQGERVSRRIPSPLRDAKKRREDPRQRARAFHPSRSSRCASSPYTTPFTPVPIARRLYDRTSHPVLVPMTSAMGIFTRESLIPPWESSLHRPKIHCTMCMYVCACDPIRLHLPQSRHNAVLCVITRRSLRGRKIS